MKAKLIDGKALSAQIREGLKPRAAALKAKGIDPALTVVLVGDAPASATYVANKEKGCAEVGIGSRVIRLGAETSEETLLELIAELNADESVYGILVQLPLPQQIDELKVIEAIAPEKDVDGFHVQSAGSLLVGGEGFVACTPKGIIKLIESTGETIEGKRAVVIGRSNIVGKPVALLLLAKNATVTVCHSRTKDLPGVCREADILVAAMGKPGFVTAEFIKPGAIVIDVGTTRVDGKLRGDVDFDAAGEVAGYITPVPGGVGPMTITMLLENTIEAGERKLHA